MPYIKAILYVLSNCFPNEDSESFLSTKDGDSYVYPNKGFLLDLFTKEASKKEMNELLHTAEKTIQARRESLKNESEGSITSVVHELFPDYSVGVITKAGSGSYASVYRMVITLIGKPTKERPQKHQHIAIKKIICCDEIHYRAVISSEMNCKGMKHDNIVKYLCDTTKGKGGKTCFYIAMPQYDCNLGVYITELYEDIELSKSKKRFANLIDICLQLAEAINYLHSRGIVHCDLKPENVMITRSLNRCRIIDFGSSVLMYEGIILKERGGTIGYTAPEMDGSREYCEKVDVYSYAMIVRDMFHPKGRSTNLLGVERDGFPVTISGEIYDDFAMERSATKDDFLQEFERAIGVSASQSPNYRHSMDSVVKFLIRMKEMMAKQQKIADEFVQKGQTPKNTQVSGVFDK